MLQNLANRGGRGSYVLLFVLFVLERKIMSGPKISHWSKLKENFVLLTLLKPYFYLEHVERLSKLLSCISLPDCRMSYCDLLYGWHNLLFADKYSFSIVVI